MSSATWYTGDTREVLATLPDASVDLVMTSPPFLALRSYLPADHPDKAKEIGSEPNPGEFLDVLLDVTEELARVLAPHGSICVELGDTYAGGGGEVASREHRPEREGTSADGGSRVVPIKDGRGWPLAKSLCMIPSTYAWALAYGRNPWTGRETDPWRVRNLIAWCRPNPPVGALGDKFRPGTSYMTVACKSGKRFFDLDAVREPVKPHSAFTRDGQTAPNGRQNMPPYDPARSNGAPPLDWWEIPTHPYPGSHYATFPPELCVRPVKAMCPQRVCRVCGKPSERIVEHERAFSGVTPHAGRHETPASGGPMGGSYEVTRETLGWSDCGHGSFACSTCGVLVPYDHALRRPAEAARSQATQREEAVLGESIGGEGVASDGSRGVRDVRDRVPGQAGGTLLHPELFSEVGALGGSGEHNRSPHADTGPEGESPRLRARVGAGGHAGSDQERLHDGASAGDAESLGPGASSMGDCPPSERDQGRQPAGEPGDRDQSATRRDGDLPALFGDVPGQLTEGYVCPCGGTDFTYVEDHWRNGIVLDPFAGSGTTLAVATGHGRDAIGIDLDPRNFDLARERIGMFLEAA